MMGMVFRQFSASVLAACILLLAIEPSAQANGTVIVLGPGGESCGSWVSHQAEARRLLQQRFVQPANVDLKALLASAPLDGIDLDRSPGDHG
jgi:hypothetical protein